MTGDQTASAIYIGLVIMLVASSLALRRLPNGKLLSLAAIWIGIVLGAWGLVTLVTGAG